MSDPCPALLVMIANFSKQPSFYPNTCWLHLIFELSYALSILQETNDSTRLLRKHPRLYRRCQLPGIVSEQSIIAQRSAETEKGRNIKA